MLRTSGQVLYNATYDTIITHDGIEHAGYLSFLALLALFPFLVLVVSLAGFMGQGEVGTRFIELLFANLPPEAVGALRPRVNELMSGPPQGLLTVAILGAIWTASSMVEGLRTILNRAYHVHTPPAYWFRRLMSILQLIIFVVIILLVMSLLVFAPLAIDTIEANLEVTIPHEEGDWADALFGFSALTLFIMVANLYYVIPNIKQTFFSIAPGAVVVVLLWIGVASLFSYYLSSFEQVNLIYGSLGSFIATLIFFYLMNLILIFGAELNYQIKIAVGEKVEERESV